MLYPPLALGSRVHCLIRYGFSSRSQHSFPLRPSDILCMLFLGGLCRSAMVRVASGLGRRTDSQAWCSRGTVGCLSSAVLRDGGKQVRVSFDELRTLVAENPTCRNGGCSAGRVGRSSKSAAAYTAR